MKNVMSVNIPDRDLIRKIKAIMVIRVILVTLIMVTGSFVFQVDKTPFYLIIAAFYLMTFVYALLLQSKLSLKANAYIQIIIDIILQMFIIHYTGGANSVYAFLYAPSIVAAGVIISSRAAKTVAGLISIFYGLVCMLEYFGIIVPVESAERLYGEGIYAVLFVVSFRIIIFCLIGYLSSTLSSNVFYQQKEIYKLRNLADIILKNITGGVLTLDTNLNVIYINPAAESILGRKEKEVLNLYWPDIFWQNPDQDKINQFLTKAKSPGRIEIAIVRPDSSKIILGCSYADLFDEDKTKVGGVITFIDLTNVKELENEVRQRDRLGAMGEMAIEIAHELRNPMASIRGALEVLKEKGQFKDNSEKLIQVVFKESSRLNRVIENFLKYAKGQQHEVEFKDLGEVIDEVWLLIHQGKRGSKSIELEKDLSPSKIILKIDKDQLIQIFYNLFLNSLDAMPNVGRISVKAEEEADCIKIIVRDEGKGIPEKELSEIFRNYYSTKTHGVGMGLAITRRIVQSNHGRIDIQAEEGIGATVILHFPKG